MTAPVTQEKSSNNSYKIAFVMPEKWTLETLPKPMNPELKMEQVPAKTVAVIRYTGSWSKEKYNKHLEKLKKWMQAKKLPELSKALWARYNSPWALWFMRRNEIQIQTQLEKKQEKKS